MDLCVEVCNINAHWNINIQYVMLLWKVWGTKLCHHSMPTYQKNGGGRQLIKIANLYGHGGGISYLTLNLQKYKTTNVVIIFLLKLKPMFKRPIIFSN